jgi:hypothetical protein
MAKDLGDSLDSIEEGVEDLKNTKFTLFGMSMTPTTIGAAFALISTVIGALYGSFEVYKDYMEMKEQIQSYEAPDLSGFQEQLSVLEAKMSTVDTNVSVIKDSLKEEINNLKGDVDRISSDVDGVQDLVRDVDDSVAGTQRDLRNDVYGLEKRVNESLRQVDADVRKVREDLEEKIQTVLANPLNDVE